MRRWSDTKIVNLPAAEKIIGRTKVDNIDLDDAKTDRKSHKTLATIIDAQGIEHDILWDSSHVFVVIPRTETLRACLAQEASSGANVELVALGRSDFFEISMRLGVRANETVYKGWLCYHNID